MARAGMQWRCLHMLPLQGASCNSPDFLERRAGFLRELTSWTLRLGSQPTTSGPALRGPAAACPGDPHVTASQPCCAPGLMQVGMCPCCLRWCAVLSRQRQVRGCLCCLEANLHSGRPPVVLLPVADAVTHSGLPA